MSNNLIKDLVLEVLEDEKENNKDFLSRSQTRKLKHQLNRKLEGNYFAGILTNIFPKVGFFKFGSRPEALTYAERLTNLIQKFNNDIELIENVDKNFNLEYKNYVFVIHAEHPYFTKFKSSFRHERENSEFVKALSEAKKYNLIEKISQSKLKQNYVIFNSNNISKLIANDTKFKVGEEVINTYTESDSTGTIICNKNLTIAEVWEI